MKLGQLTLGIRQGFSEQARHALAVPLLELLETGGDLGLDGALERSVVAAHDDRARHLGDDGLRIARPARWQCRPRATSRHDLNHELESDERRALEPRARDELVAELADRVGSMRLSSGDSSPSAQVMHHVTQRCGTSTAVARTSTTSGCRGFDPSYVSRSFTTPVQRSEMPPSSTAPHAMRLSSTSSCEPT